MCSQTSCTAAPLLPPAFTFTSHRCCGPSPSYVGGGVVVGGVVGGVGGGFVGGVVFVVFGVLVVFVVVVVVVVFVVVVVVVVVVNVFVGGGGVINYLFMSWSGN